MNSIFWEAFLSPFMFFPMLLCLLEMIWEKYYLKIDRSWKELFVNSSIFFFYFFWNGLLILAFDFDFPVFVPAVFVQVEEWKWFSLDYGFLEWVGCFLLVEFLYYCHHRLMHTSHFLFAEHSIHHSSKEFNMSTSLRISWWMLLYMGIAYMPAVLFGFPPVMIWICIAITWLWQHIIHFDRCPKLGFLEWIFVTPSHHRVHHGYSKKYLHKNFGGTLIIWDRLLGTFQEEQEKPSYGMGMEVNSKNPFWLQTVYLYIYIKNAYKKS